MSAGESPEIPQEALLETIQRAAEADAKSAAATVVAADEKAPVEAEAEFLDHEYKVLRNQEFKETLAARKRYGLWAFVLMAIWLATVLLTVWLSSVSFISPSWYPAWLPTMESFKVSDQVLLGLIGSTTANILGLLVIMFNFLFPKSWNRD